MRLLTVSRLTASASVMVTSWPASANTCAMPWPMRPAPMTAIRALAMPSAPLARRVAAVGVEDVAGVEVRRLGGEEQQRPREVGGLAEPAFRHTRDEALAHRGR